MENSERNIAGIIASLRKTAGSETVTPVEKRIGLLKKLKKAVTENEKAIMDALRADLNKSGPEAFMTEINVVVHEIDHAIKHVKRWARPKRVKTPLSLQPGLSFIHKDPLGLVLIIAPWNYPFNLLFSPLAGAIAAGNTVLLKPSEVAPRTSALARDLIGRYFDPSVIAVMEGGPEVTTEILTHKFDHIFFTGGETVGKIVMTAAAKHLTPVTLELGGKSPCVVDSTADIKLAAKRIAWGKFTNAGQTCIAPDYLLVQKSVADELVQGIKTAVTDFFGSDPEKSPYYGRIINKRHAERIQSLMTAGKTVFGGKVDVPSRYIAPTVLTDVTLDDPVMIDEIFGPVLPVLTFDAIGDAVDLIRKKPKPLALYLFSSDEKSRERILGETSSGGVCINDTLMHISSTELPFGGVGTSGMGGYHGKASFDTFSHSKSVLRRFPVLDPFFRYAPFKPYLRWILKTVP